MGVKLVGDVARLLDREHLEVRVLYHSPLGLLSGAISDSSPVVGGKMGMRYLINGGKVTQHSNRGRGATQRSAVN